MFFAPFSANENTAKLRGVKYTSTYSTLHNTSILLLLLLLFLNGCNNFTAHHESIPTLQTITKERTVTANITPSEPTFAPQQKAFPFIKKAPEKTKTSIFLAHLSQHDITLIKEEASRVILPRWQTIDTRSQKVRMRMLDILNTLSAPQELLFIPVAESSYNPYALSASGAFGLWQLMPRTAVELGALHKNGIDGRRQIETSTKAAISYLLTLHQRFDDWTLAICAYNLGPWGVERRLRKKPWTHDMGLNALPFPAETKHYVKQILGMIALADAGKLVFSKGLTTQSIHIDAPIDLTQIEQASGLQKAMLFHFNPGFDYQHYTQQKVTLHLPEENHQILQHVLNNNPNNFKPKFINISIKKGDSLWSISRKHHTSIRHLKQLNPKLGNVLSIGKSITVPASNHFTTASNKANPLLSQGRRIRYKVRSGDSLWKIAKKFGTSTRAIAKSNQIRANKLIRPGDKLWIIAQLRPR